jgi:hypothetical protein
VFDRKDRKDDGTLGQINASKVIDTNPKNNDIGNPLESDYSQDDYVHNFKQWMHALNELVIR